MTLKAKKPLTLLLALLAAIFVCMSLANNIQRNGGNVSVESGAIETDLGTLTYKLYKPNTATSSAPAPAVLLLHGYQNDHETSAAYAVELARRGVVVLALDEYGHGSTRISMINRGYVNHKVSVTYGQASEVDGTYISIGGATRYKLMMNFSNLSFFDPYYSTDSESIYFSNVLLLQAKYDEFNYFRDYADTVTDDLIRSDLRTEFLGCSVAEAKWNTTYGSFADGTARRVELLNTNHRLATHNGEGMATALAWLTQAIDINSPLSPTDQLYMVKEWLVFAAMLCGIAAMLPLMELLCLTPFFASVKQSIPNRPQRVKSGRKWWKGAIITVLIAAITYPFMTQLGHGLLPLPEGIFRMTIGNGFLSWYLLLILVMLGTTIFSWKRSKKKGEALDYVDLGLSSERKAKHIDWTLCGKSALLALCMVGFLYLLVVICEAAFLLDFRFIWPFFKGFTLARFGQFLVYILILALFFLLNNSKIFAQSRIAGADKPGIKGFLSCWWKYAFCMVGGVLLIILLEYIPFFAGIGPGADLLFGSTFGGPFMSLLIVFAPQVLVFSILCTYCYRRTGSVYTGAFTVAAMACWIVTGGSAML